MSEQLALSILADAEREQRIALDRHRARIQTWFDALPAHDKDSLAEWLTIFEWDTCAALAAAAGDYRCSRGISGK